MAACPINVTFVLFPVPVCLSLSLSLSRYLSLSLSYSHTHTFVSHTHTHTRWESDEESRIFKGHVLLTETDLAGLYILQSRMGGCSPNWHWEAECDSLLMSVQGESRHLFIPVPQKVTSSPEMPSATLEEGEIPAPCRHVDKTGNMNWQHQA